jgi:hypothetical protein
MRRRLILTETGEQPMRIVTLAIALVFASVAQAHEADGPNGRRIVDAGNLHVELVAKGRSVNVFVTDANDKPVAVEGYKGTAVLVIAGKPHDARPSRSVRCSMCVQVRWHCARQRQKERLRRGDEEANKESEHTHLAARYFRNTSSEGPQSFYPRGRHDCGTGFC